MESLVCEFKSFNSEIPILEVVNNDDSEHSNIVISGKYYVSYISDHIIRIMIENKCRCIGINSNEIFIHGLKDISERWWDPSDTCPIPGSGFTRLGPVINRKGTESWSEIVSILNTEYPDFTFRNLVQPLVKSASHTRVGGGGGIKIF